MSSDSHDKVDTNSHTYFFREPAALDAVGREIIRPKKGRAPVRIWSAGCATGDEPFSLAIISCEMGAQPTILATDINPQALRAARRAEFSGRALRQMTPQRRDRWFEGTQDRFRILAPPKSLVTFELHDVTGPAPSPPDTTETEAVWDAILCRNVLIYLDLKEMAGAVASFIHGLVPGGLLFLGASEWLSSKLQAWVPALAELQLVEISGAIAYRRLPARAERFSPPPEQGILAVAPSVRRIRPQPIVPPCAPAVESPRPQPVRSEASLMDRLRQRGDALLDRGDTAGALEVYEEALGEDDMAADLILRTGICHLRRGREQQAVAALRRSLFLEPTLWPAAFLLGDLIAAEDPKVAERYFARAQVALQGEMVREEERPPPVAPFAAGQTVALEAIRLRLADLRQGGDSCA